MQRAININLYLTAEQIQRFYAGNVQQVLARDSRGRKVAFPVSSLRPFVDHAGVRGKFRLWIDRENRLQRIDRYEK